MKAQQMLYAGHYFGQVEKAVEANGIILTTSDYRQHTHLPAHFHENSYFCLVSHGHYQESIFSQTLDCTASDVIYHPAGITHSNAFPQSRALCFNVEIAQSWLNQLDADFTAPDKIQKVKSPVILSLLHKLKREAEHADAASGLMIEGLTMQCLSLFMREQSSHQYGVPAWVRTVQEWLHVSYRTDVSLAQLSALVQISPFHLVRTFKKVFGMSVGDYVNKLRVEYAVGLLQGRELPLAHIALECNFADQSHFGRIFKRVKGMTPGQYQQAFVAGA